MSGLEIKLDTSAIAGLAPRFARATLTVPEGVARAINRAGDQARTAMIRAETAQTGLSRKTIVAALKTPKRATAAGLTYVIASEGGNVRLRYFAPRETRAGVSAAPWSNRQVFMHTFMKGGQFPNRHGGIAGGKRVYMRTGPARFPVKSGRSGLFIPDEMVKGATAASFTATVERVLVKQLEQELARAIGAL